MSASVKSVAAKNPPEGRLLTVAEAAVALSISESAMRRLVRQRAIEIVRVTEGRVAVERRALDAFIAARRQKAVAT